MKDSLTLAGDHLLRVLSPEHHFIPFYEFHINERMEAWAWMRGASHNIPRWIDAMLRLEAATGYAIPAETEAVMIENLRLMFDNPDHLCLYPMDEPALPAEAADTLLEYHSMREGLLALTAMIVHRQSEWATDKAVKMIDTIDRISDTGLEHWNVQLLDRWKRLDRPGAPISRTVLDSGRFMEAGMHYVQATGNEQARALIGRFAAIHYEHNTWPGGAYELNWANYHTHSYLGTLKGLLLYGALSDEKKYVDRVAETYSMSIRTNVVRESGLAFHDGDKETGADPAAAGDAMQIALWLARCGYPEFLDDAERIVRSRLLPAQLTDCPELADEELPRDEEGTPFFINQVSADKRPVSSDVIFHPRDMHHIVNGGWGIQREAHWARQATTDVSCAVLHSLCDFYEHIAVDTPSGLRINFHVDYEDERIKIAVHRGDQAQLQIDNRGGNDLEIRIPDWAPDTSLAISIDGESVDAVPVNGILTCHAPQQVEIGYDLPERTTEETANGVTYTFHWRGDQVLGIRPNKRNWLPLYPDLA